ncbi:MAG: tetratricopeptide repeat protein [Dehalococcoidia bacterium]|nr:tetratricopeptide repeat protein [Dehalococcoidia bacterium]
MSDLASARTVATPARRTLSGQQVARGVALAAAGSWVGYFLFTGMPQLTLDVFPRTITLHILVGVLAATYVLALVARRRLPGGTPLDLPLLGFIAAYAIATYTSINWRVSLEATLQVGTAIIVFYALSELPWLSAQQLTRALMLVGAALALYALWVVGRDYADYLSLTRSVEGLRAANIFPPTVPRVHDVSDHTNVLAMLLVLVMPFFLLAAVRGGLRGERPLAGAALVVAAMALFLTLSRGAWAGAVTGMVLTLAGVWLTLTIDARERAGERLRWADVLPAGISPTAIAAIGGALALMVFGALAFLARSSTRPGWLFRSSLSPREDAWRVGWRIFQDHVLTGAGPNSFALLYDQYSGKFPVFTQHAHNGFLQLADDTGVLGLLALAAVVGAAAFMLYRTWRAGSLEQRLLAVACAAALVGFGVHNIVDAGNIWKAPGIALAVVGAIIARNDLERRAAARASAERGDAAAPADSRRAGRARRRIAPMLPRALLLLLLALPFLAWYRIDRAHYHAYLAVNDFNQRFDPAQPTARFDALREMQAAVNEDSSLAVYQLELGDMQATAFQETGRQDRSLIANAVVHLQRAVALDPRSDLAHANLARAYALAGRDDDAAAEAAKTRVIARTNWQPVLMVGDVYEDTGRGDTAIETYAQAISMNASLAGATYWQQTPFRRTNFPAIIKQSIVGLNPCTHGAYLVEARRYDAASSLDGLDADAKGCSLLVFSTPNDLTARVALARMQMQQGKLEDAFGQLDAAVRRQPDFGPARTALGQWYALKGDIAAARRQWVLGGQLQEPESLLLLGESYGDGQVPADVAGRLRALVQAGGARQQADLISILYFRMKYGRISPVVPMIPGEWQQAEPRLYTRIREALARWQPDARPIRG